MSEKATNVGNLAGKILSSGRRGDVTRVFQRSVYIRSGDGFILLLWGRLRSPMTISMEESRSAEWRIRAGERCILSKEAVRLEAGEIDLRGAEVFRSALLDSRKIVLPEGPALAKGVAMLRSLYDLSPSGQTLASDPVLKSFTRVTLLPLSSGRTGAVYNPSRYLRLVGRGGGFTPAGDDFVGGLVATFNYIARCRKRRQVLIPRDLVRGRTIPESAAILSNSARGHVDEGMERLILASTGGRTGFYSELMAVARRGHTSGIEMSLGVLLCEAALAQAEGEHRALQKCLDVLWKP
jgi:hypothetical protein